MSDDKRGLPTKVKMRHDSHFVDRLEERHGAPVGKMVALESIEPDPDQPRASMGDLGDLTASIRERGVLEPILVRPLTADGGADAAGEQSRPFRIISGERRFRAATLAGLYEIPVIEMDVGDEEALELALIENLQRKDLTPFEEAEGYQALHARYGYTQEEIARTVGKSRTVITESLALLRMPPPARQTALALGLTSKSLLLEVAKAGTEEEMVDLLGRVAERKLSRDDLRQETRQPQGRPGQRKPYTFRFKAPDKTYSLSLSFRKTEVERGDLISALEQILQDLRTEQQGD